MRETTMQVKRTQWAPIGLTIGALAGAVLAFTGAPRWFTGTVLILVAVNGALWTISEGVRRG